MDTHDEVGIDVDGATHKTEKQTAKGCPSGSRRQASDEEEVPANNCNNISIPRKKSSWLSQPSSDHCRWSLFKVPYLQRQVNEKAYQPTLISIGPYYRNLKHLKKMEIIKENCLNAFICRNEAMHKKIATALKAMQEDVRKCYPEALDGIESDHEFVEMMIHDGCFILYFILNDTSNEPFFGLNRIQSEIYRDLLLFENQIPFSVLSRLYGMIKCPNAEMDEFARCSPTDEFALWSPADEFASRVLERFLTVLPGGHFPREFSARGIKHLLGLIYDSWIPHPTATRVEDQGPLVEFIRSATEIEEAGIKFVKKDDASSLFDIDFTDDAKLKIPTLHIAETTELILRNFLAYEQFLPRYKPTYVCDYVVFMDNLIDSGKDVQLLRHSGVIVNWLGDDDAVAEMFNKLRNFAYSTQHSFYYKKMFKKVNCHCQKRRYRWKAKLHKDYFNSPWSIISVIAAVVLLLLTMLQSIFSVLSYIHPQ